MGMSSILLPNESLTDDLNRSVFTFNVLFERIDTCTINILIGKQSFNILIRLPLRPQSHFTRELWLDSANYMAWKWLYSTFVTWLPIFVT